MACAVTAARIHIGCAYSHVLLIFSDGLACRGNEILQNLHELSNMTTVLKVHETRKKVKANFYANGNLERSSLEGVRDSLVSVDAGSGPCFSAPKLGY